MNAAAMILLLHDGLTWTRTVIGWLVMVPLYAVVVWAISLNLRPMDDGWRARVPVRVIVVTLAAFAAAYYLIFVVGF